MRSRTRITSLPYQSGDQAYSDKNKYVPGAGVGAVSASVRRSKIRFATSCSQSGGNCGAFYLTLGNDKLPIIPSFPNAPVITGITSSNQSLTVSFTQLPNGTPITNYAYSLSGVEGPFTPLSPPSVSNPFTIVGLVNGVLYDVFIVAISSSGTSAPSNSVSGTPLTVPGSPTSLVATPGNTAASISFTPGANGGAAITNYLYSINNGAYQSAGTAVSPIVITGLTNGVTYQVNLKAVNSVGTGGESSAVSVVPATVPNAPSSLVATPGNTTASISFTPGANGGAAITNYLYSINNGAYQSAGTAVSPIVITGLTNGVTYQVNLKAVNSVGTGGESSAVSVVPNVSTVVSQFKTVGTTTWTAPAGVTSVDYLVVGGGGGSGGTHDGGGAGGGGGGMVFTGTKSVVPGTAYTITVGAGGAGGEGNPLPLTRETNGESGTQSVFADITALGGGLGKRSRETGAGTPGTKAIHPGTATTGGYGGSFNQGGGGGGGDSADGGANPAGTSGGAGGGGTSSDITGTLLTYGAGGDGGDSTTVDPAIAGAVNTGNGAKGPGTPFSSYRSGAQGGSGIVVLKYLN